MHHTSPTNCWRVLRANKRTVESVDCVHDFLIDR